MDIQKLVNLKKNNFNGSGLEIIKKGKEIIIQIGEEQSNIDIKNNKDNLSNYKSNDFLDNQNPSTQIKKKSKIYFSPNLVKNIQKIKKNENKDKKINQILNNSNISKYKKDKINNQENISKKNNKKNSLNNHKLNRNLEKIKHSKRKTEKNIKQNKTNFLTQNKTSEFKKSETIYFSRKINRNSYVNTKESNKSLNYLDFYKGL